jgi:hypothetical protein
VLHTSRSSSDSVSFFNARLAVANFAVDNGDRRSDEVNREDHPRVLRIEGDFQNISSYVHPDVSDVTAIRPSHQDLLSVLRKPPEPAAMNPSESASSGLSSIGIPLLLPLTVGVEYEEEIYQRSAKTRSLGVRVDSLSIMLSTEDHALIQALCHKWSTSVRPSSVTPRKTYKFDVSFETVKLGLGLRKQGSAVVVDHVEPDAIEKSIAKGDLLYSIDGVDLADTTSVALSDIVERLGDQPRPLIITFTRSMGDTPEEDGLKILPPFYLGSVDKVDLTLSSGVLTLIDNEVTLVQAALSKSVARLQQFRSSEATYNINIASELAVNYYNLRTWTWEPFLEPGHLFLTAQYRDPRKGARDLSIELGDHNGPLRLNLADAGLEALSKLCLPRLTSDGTSAVETSTMDSSAELANARVASADAANAALQFAHRQTRDSAKPFVFLNQTGMSVAFALQSEQLLSSSRPPAASGSSESNASFVEHGRESKFYVVAHDKARRRFPFLTVFFHTAGDIVLEAIRDLDISQAGETMIPLTICADESAYTSTTHTLQWASWTVEQTEEKTILTLGGSIQLMSVLQETLEIGLEFKEQGSMDTKFSMIGLCKAGNLLYLPLWVGLRQCEWACVARLRDSGPTFTGLFGVSDDLNQLHEKFVELRSTPNDDTPDRFVSLTVDGSSGMHIVSIDCGITFRNLLPSPIHWVICSGAPPTSITIDSSHLRARRTANHCLLESGDRVEVFSNGYEGLSFQICYAESWSSSVTLSFAKDAIPGVTYARPPAFHEMQIADEFVFPLSLGVRMASKGGCIDVVVYADLWCSNLTSLPLSFGCPVYETTGASEGENVKTETTELSTAEAALKEISSLFDGAGNRTDMKGHTLKRSEGIIEMRRLPHQVVSAIVEECFEYVEMGSQNNNRRWWATDNPEAPKELASVDESATGQWEWLDASWVSQLSHAQPSNRKISHALSFLIEY